MFVSCFLVVKDYQSHLDQFNLEINYYHSVNIRINCSFFLPTPPYSAVITRLETGAELVNSAQREEHLNGLI